MAAFLTSCSAPSRGSVYTRIEKDIKIGATKTEVLNYVKRLEINGIKANSSGFIKSPSGEKIFVNEKKVNLGGFIDIDFRGRGVFYCGSFVVFYFDESEKLVSYVTEDIFC